MFRFIMKIILGIGLLVALTGGYLFAFGTSDLRTDEAIFSPNKKNARVLLQKMGQAHGIENWKDLETYSVEFRDEFYGVFGEMGNPFPMDTAEFMLTYIPNTYDGKLEYLNGPFMTQTWGIQSWKTYRSNLSQGLKFEENAEMKFWIPTYQYFIEFPMRIQTADTVAYAGEKKINEIDCEGIIASWNTITPQRDVDQYLIWINKETHQIVKLEYTIRDQYNFLKGAVSFLDYQNFNGMLIPTNMPVESNLVNGEVLHKMEILDILKNPITQRELRPNQALKILGDEKL